uniref:Nardilysin-like n=1 Tax=Crocodylus porosus TaxID=8502 RepID=A0A7M4EA18_CROPO
MLISDITSLDGVASEESSEGEDETDTERDNDDDDSGAEIEDDEENKIFLGVTSTAFIVFNLQSAAALCVGVGSFCDPEDLPGLAHFLEHMVFMGSLKYPDENGFDAFVREHGGSDNASTDCERTVFQFDIQQKYFKEALDRWAQFFIHPLMVWDAIDREVEAVDSEYQLAKPSDANRRELLLGSLAKPGHPMRKFFWGNAETLKHEPKNRNIDIYARLKDFWQLYYSAHYMNLVVQSKGNISYLKIMLYIFFLSGLPKPSFGHLTQPFDTPEFHKLYRVLNFSIFFRVKPLHYISWLVGHEGKGSILSFLRKKFWALTLHGGNSETGFEQNSTYSIFSISVTLTEEGYEYFYEIAHAIFQYLKMLQKRGPDKRIWEEIQKIEDNEFRFQDQTDPADFVESLCENMQHFQKEDFLIGNNLLLDYKPEVSSLILKCLCPLKANLFLLSAGHEEKCHLKERWFETQYSVEDIDKYWSDLWASDFELNQDLHLPEENKYIASNFTLKVRDCSETQHPVKILNTQLGCLWYKKDNKFRIPKAYVRFHLISPLIQQCSKSVVLFELFVNIFSHNLAEPAYEADVAQLEYKVVAGEHGLIIRVKGFNHKLPLLFQLIIDHLADFNFTPATFEMITEQLKKTYFNILIKPEMLAKDVRLFILEHGRWSIIDKYQRLMKGISVESLSAFIKAFKSHLFVEGLAQGNLTGRVSTRLSSCSLVSLQFVPLAHPCPVQFRVVDLPNTHLLCKVKTLNKGDANSEVTVYYQSGARSLREYTLMELLVHVSPPNWNYLQNSTVWAVLGSRGNNIISEVSLFSFSTELVDKKIEEFLVCFEEKLKILTTEVFNAQVSVLINMKECEDSYLGEEVDRNWNEIVTQQYFFDRLAHEVMDSVVGFGKHEGDSDIIAASDAQQCYLGDMPQFIFLPPSSHMKDTASIRDIRDFTLALNLLPYHKILK